MPIQVRSSDDEGTNDGEEDREPHEEAAAGGSESSRKADEMPEILVLTSYSRYPEEFRQALLEGPHLQRCRKAMSDAGHSCMLPTGAKIFCLPEQYPAVCLP